LVEVVTRENPKKTSRAPKVKGELRKQKHILGEIRSRSYDYARTGVMEGEDSRGEIIGKRNVKGGALDRVTVALQRI